VSLEFFIDIKSLRSRYGPGVDSASNRNEYQEHFLGGKEGRCVRLTTLPPSCAVVMKSGNFIFLEPSGPLQACNRTALTFLHIIAPKMHTGLLKLPCIQNYLLHVSANHVTNFKEVKYKGWIH